MNTIIKLGSKCSKKRNNFIFKIKRSKNNSMARIIAKMSKHG